MRIRSFRSFALVVVPALVAAGGCGESTSPPPPPPPPPAATQLVFVAQPAPAVAGATIAPAVRVEARTGAGALVTTFTGTVVIALSGGAAGATLLGSASTAAVAGVATFADLRIEKSGAGYTLVASSGSLSAATSSGFDITAGPAAQLAMTVAPADAPGGRPINPGVMVAVRDGFGNLVTSGTPTVRMAIGTNPGNARLSGTTSVAAASGLATFANLRLDRPGTAYTLQATSDGLAPVTSAPFAVRIVFASVAAGRRQACGVTTSGAAYCWGFNDRGQLGDATTSSSSTPELVAGELTFASVRAGEVHSCGLTPAGAAYCWGNNFAGQLGDGTTTNRLTPVPVGGGITFSALSVGEYHTCGVTAARVAYCWGYNGSGELGIGSTANSSSPAAVAGGLSFASVSAGVEHTCGLTTAGAAYCWGTNPWSQLGDGTTTDRMTPVPVAGGLTFATLRAGFRFSCAVTSAGAGYCWGLNVSNQLGDGTSAATQPAPVAIAGGLTFASVAAGYAQHGCGLATSGAAYCWGTNAFGELGLGNTVNSGHAVPFPVTGGLTFATLDTGFAFTCGVTPAGLAYCWGYNSDGALGDGTNVTRSVPTRVVH